MIVMVGAAGLALKDHGRDQTLKGLSAPSAVVAPLMDGARRAYADRARSVACHDLFKVRPASQSRGATRVGCAPDVARRIHMGSAASGGDSLRQGL